MPLDMARLRSRDLFPTDGPIAPDRMIGRGEEVEDLARTLQNGLHRIIAGPRRTGKTTVCRAAVARAREAGCYAVEIDLFAIPNRAELAEALVARTIANRPGVHKALERLRRAGRTVVKTAGMAAVVKSKTELGDELEIAFEPGLAYRDPDRYLAYALKLPQRVAEADRKRLILFFDEFQEIAGEREPYGDPDALTKQMRSILQDSDSVTCLFAGSAEHLMRDLFAPRRRAFFQFGGFHELTPIDRDDWREGLSARFAEDGCTIDQPALSRVIELGDLHPRATMLIAQQTHDTSVALGTTVIDASLVAQGYEAARLADRVNHELTVQRIRELSKHALVVARRIARGQTAYAGLEAKAAQRALHALRDAGIVEHRARGEWRLTEPLLREYLVEPERA